MLHSKLSRMPNQVTSPAYQPTTPALNTRHSSLDSTPHYRSMIIKSILSVTRLPCDLFCSLWLNRSNNNELALENDGKLRKKLALGEYLRSISIGTGHERPVVQQNVSLKMSAKGLFIGGLLLSGSRNGVSSYRNKTSLEKNSSDDFSHSITTTSAHEQLGILDHATQSVLPIPPNRSRRSYRHVANETLTMRNRPYRGYPCKKDTPCRLIAQENSHSSNNVSSAGMKLLPDTYTDYPSWFIYNKDISKEKNAQRYLNQLRRGCGRNTLSEQYYIYSLLEKLSWKTWPIDFILLYSDIEEKHSRLKVYIYNVKSSLAYINKTRPRHCHMTLLNVFYYNSLCNRYNWSHSQKVLTLQRIISKYERDFNILSDNRFIISYLLHTDNPNIAKARRLFNRAVSIVYAKVEKYRTNRMIFQQHLENLNIKPLDKTHHTRSVLKKLIKRLTKKTPILLKQYYAMINAERIEADKRLYSIEEKINQEINNSNVFQMNISDAYNFTHNFNLTQFPKQIDHFILSSLKQYNINIEPQQLDHPCSVTFHQPYDNEVVLFRSSALNNSIENTFNLRDFLLGEPHRHNILTPLRHSLPMLPTPFLIKRVSCGNNKDLNKLLNDYDKQLSISNDVMSQLSSVLFNYYNDKSEIDAYRKIFHASILGSLSFEVEKIENEENIAYQYIVDEFLSGQINPGLVYYKGRIVPGIVYLGEGDHKLIISLDNSRLVIFSTYRENSDLYTFIYSHLAEIDKDKNLISSGLKNRRLPLTLNINAILSELDYHIDFKSVNDKSIHIDLFHSNIDKLRSNLNGLIYTQAERDSHHTIANTQAWIDAISTVLFLESLIIRGPTALAIFTMTNTVLAALSIYNDVKLVKLSDRHQQLEEAKTNLLLNALFSTGSFLQDVALLTKTTGNGLRILKAAKTKALEIRQYQTAVFPERQINTVLKKKIIPNVLNQYDCQRVFKRGISSSKHNSLCQYATLSAKLNAKIKDTYLVTPQQINIDARAKPDALGLVTGPYGEKYIKHNQGYLPVHKDKDLFIYDEVGNRFYIKRRKNKFYMVARDKTFSDSSLEKIKLTSIDIAAFNNYGGTGYHNVNDYLRNNRLGWDTMAEQLEQFIVELDSALSKLPPYHGTIYRGAGIKLSELTYIQEVGFIANKNYWSCSTHLPTALGFQVDEYSSLSKVSDTIIPVLYEISVKETAFPIRMHTMRKYEQEVLIKHDSFFNLVNVKPNPYGKAGVHIVLEESVIDDIPGLKIISDRHRDDEIIQQVNTMRDNVAAHRVPKVSYADTPLSSELKSHITDAILLSKDDVAPIYTLNYLGLSANKQQQKYLSYHDKYIPLMDEGPRNFFYDEHGNQIYIFVKENMFHISKIKYHMHR